MPLSATFPHGFESGLTSLCPVEERMCALAEQDPTRLFLEVVRHFVGRFEALGGHDRIAHDGVLPFIATASNNPTTTGPVWMPMRNATVGRLASAVAGH